MFNNYKSLVSLLILSCQEDKQGKASKHLLHRFSNMITKIHMDIDGKVFIGSSKIWILNVNCLASNKDCYIEREVDKSMDERFRMKRLAHKVILQDAVIFTWRAKY